METRRSTAERNIAAIAEQAVVKARVLQAGGAVIPGSLKNALQTAAQIRWSAFIRNSTKPTIRAGPMW